MSKVSIYVENMFAGLPHTRQAAAQKTETRQRLEARYAALLAEGKNEDEALGIVVAENDDLKVSDDNFMRFTTHGRVYLPEETTRLRSDLQTVLRKNTVDHEWHPVFDTPCFLIALFLLLMTEWFLRRRYNLF